MFAGMFCLQQVLCAQAATSRMDSSLIDLNEGLTRDGAWSLRFNTKPLVAKLQSETAQFRTLLFENIGVQTPRMRRASSNPCSSAMAKVSNLVATDASCKSLVTMFAEMGSSTTGSETSFDPSMSAKLCGSSCFASVKATFAAALRDATAAEKASPECVPLAAMMPMYDLMCLKEVRQIAELQCRAQSVA